MTDRAIPATPQSVSPPPRDQLSDSKINWHLRGVFILRGVFRERTRPLLGPQDVHCLRSHPQDLLVSFIPGSCTQHVTDRDTQHQANYRLPPPWRHAESVVQIVVCHARSSQTGPAKHINSAEDQEGIRTLFLAQNNRHYLQSFEGKSGVIWVLTGEWCVRRGGGPGRCAGGRRR
jgi:hypothetical protein